MRRLVSLLLVLVMLVGAGATLFAAGQQEDGELVVGLSLPTQREERWVRDRETMEAYAEELGLDLRVQVADADTAQQIGQVENLFAQGIDVLILAPHDASAAATLVDAAEEEGIPVISYDRLITDTPNVDVYISFDNVKVGELQGEFFVNNVPDGSNIIIMAGASTDNNATLFKQGAMTFIGPKVDSGAYNVIAEQSVDNWLPENALAIVENALTVAGNDVQGILAPNDGTAGGAIVALEAQGLAGDVIVTGQDAALAAAKRIAVEGTQQMTIFKDTRELGREAIDTAIRLAEGEELPINGAVDNGVIDVPSILLTPFVVTEDNLDELLIESGYLSRDEVYN
ncbi:MAG: sugar ABC transporter substrate-binding protein [Spirochaetales bacterium]